MSLPTVAHPQEAKAETSESSEATEASATALPAGSSMEDLLLGEIEDYLRFIESATGAHQARLREDCVRQIRLRLQGLRSAQALQALASDSIGRKPTGKPERLLTLVKSSRSALSSGLSLACEWLPRMAHGAQAASVEAAHLACARLHARMITLGRRWPDALCEEGAQSILRALRLAHLLLDQHPDEKARLATTDLDHLVREMSLAAEMDRQQRTSQQRNSHRPATPPGSPAPLADNVTAEVKPEEPAPEEPALDRAGRERATAA
jgi:hypothetical protein